MSNIISEDNAESTNRAQNEQQRNERGILQQRCQTVPVRHCSSVPHVTLGVSLLRLGDDAIGPVLRHAVSAVPIFFFYFYFFKFK
jgi:hypothetical protein